MRERERKLKLGLNLSGNSRYLHPADPEDGVYVRGFNSRQHGQPLLPDASVTVARHAAANKARLFIAHRSRSAYMNLRVGIFLETFSRERERERERENHPMTASAYEEVATCLPSAFSFSFSLPERAKRRVRGFAILLKCKSALMKRVKDT